MPTPVIAQVQSEQGQGPQTRKGLFVRLEKELQRPVVSYYTSVSISRPASIEDSDADVLESVLRHTNLSKGFALLINSHGGYGEAAERIINVCRSASGTGEFWAIIPGKAKSAATMICFGASKLLMGASSELGPIDPQLTVVENNVKKRFSVWNLVQGYKELFAKAVKEEGNLEPYLLQLKAYDAREIKEWETAIALSEDIAIRSLATGMMKGKSIKDIRNKIHMFLTPEEKKSHGRPIYHGEAKSCDLTVDKVDPSSKLGKLVYELHVRTSNFVRTKVYKCVESKEHGFSAPYED
jgi:ClpP class serine protease